MTHLHFQSVCCFKVEAHQSPIRI